MKQMRWHLCLSVFALALLALAWPGTAAAAPDGSALLSPLAGSTVVDAPTQPTFAIPGIFSIKFGNTAGDAEIDLPSLNTVGTVSGLVIGQNVSWDFLSLSQKQPVVTTVATISEAKVGVYGPQRGYTSEASASFKLNPSSAFQTSGKVGFGYDGLNRTFGFTLQNLDMVVATESAKVALSGVNNTPGEFKFDALKVEVPSAGASMVMSGYQVKNGKADWKSLSIMNTPNMALQIGNVVSVSEMQASVAGASAGYATMASANLKVDAGQSAKVNGKLYVINDPANRQSGVALSKGNMAFQVPGWNLQVDGINSIQGGVKVDTVSLAAEPLSLTAEVTGVVVSDTTGFAFDQAKVAYAPTAGGANGFAMTVTRSDAGYVLTTTTVFPVAARK